VVDLFEEVEEQLRSDRYRDLARRAWPWITGLFAAVLLGYLAYWGFAIWQGRNLETATSEYQKGVDAAAGGDQKSALAHFQAATKAGAPAYKSLALMQEAGISLANGKPADAAKLYDEAAAAAPNRIFADLARLRAALALIDTAPFPQLQTRLAPLTDAKRPYTFQAREALALAKLMAGKGAEARRDFSSLSLSLGVPEDVRQRAQVDIELIDSGEAAAAVAAVKAAATMPPSAAATVQPPPAAGQGAPSQTPSGAAQ